MSERYTLPRTGNAPLTFSGTLLTASNGKQTQGPGQNRWHEISLYQTDAGRYVCAIEYHSLYQDEQPNYLAGLCESPSAVVDFLRSYDPTANMVGYPPHEVYRERNVRLRSDIMARFYTQVSDVLSDPAFAVDADADTVILPTPCAHCISLHPQDVGFDLRSDEYNTVDTASGEIWPARTKIHLPAGITRVVAADANDERVVVEFANRVDLLAELTAMGYNIAKE